MRCVGRRSSASARCRRARLASLATAAALSLLVVAAAGPARARADGVPEDLSLARVLVYDPVAGYSAVRTGLVTARGHVLLLYNGFLDMGSFAQSPPILTVNTLYEGRDLQRVIAQDNWRFSQTVDAGMGRRVGLITLPFTRPLPPEPFYPLGYDQQLQAGDEVTVRGYVRRGSLTPVERTLRIATDRPVDDPRPSRGGNQQVITAHVTRPTTGALNDRSFLGAPVLRNGEVIGLYAGTPDSFSAPTIQPGTVLYIAPLTIQLNPDNAYMLVLLNFAASTNYLGYELAPDGTLRKKDGNPPPPPPGGAGAAACLVGPSRSGIGRARVRASLPNGCVNLPSPGDTAKLDLPFSDDHPVAEVTLALVRDGKPLLADKDGKPVEFPGETLYTAREATMPRFRTAVSGGGVEVTVTRPSVTAAGHSLYGYRVYYATSDRWDDVKSVDISSQDDDKGSATIHPTAGKVTFVTVVPKIYDHIWQTAWPVGVKNDKPLPGDESNMVAQLDPPIVGWKS